MKNLTGEQQQELKRKMQNLSAIFTPPLSPRLVGADFYRQKQVAQTDCAIFRGQCPGKAGEFVKAWEFLQKEIPI